MAFNLTVLLRALWFCLRISSGDFLFHRSDSGMAASYRDSVQPTKTAGCQKKKKNDVIVTSLYAYAVYEPHPSFVCCRELPSKLAWNARTRFFGEFYKQIIEFLVAEESWFVIVSRAPATLVAVLRGRGTTR